MNLSEKNLAVIGAGNIGQILLERLRAAGVPADHLVVCDSDKSRANAVAERFGVRSVILADEGACGADACAGYLTCPSGFVLIFGLFSPCIVI